jgi:hypothetical protein
MTMSKFIETKNTNQCRSYVQKLLKKFISMQEVLLFFAELGLAGTNPEKEKYKEDFSEVSRMHCK